MIRPLYTILAWILFHVFLIKELKKGFSRGRSGAGGGGGYAMHSQYLLICC
jgi:hypothetical protein